MENYICIHGNKVELTEEQIKQLGFEGKKKSPFKRAELNNGYFYIEYDGNVTSDYEAGGFTDNAVFKTANYCTDKSLMEQRALHETLNRLLWRYSMEHDGDQVKEECHGVIRCRKGVYEAYTSFGHSLGEAKFYDIITAQNAIKEIVEPFMKEHPEFKW